MSALGNKNSSHSILRVLLPCFALLSMAVGLQSIGEPNYFLNELVYLSSPYYDVKGIAKATIYLVSYVISVGLVLVVAIQRSLVLLITLTAYIYIAYCFDVLSQLTGSRRGFTHFQYELFLNEAGNYKNLLIFLSEITKALLITGVLLLLVMLVRRHIKTRLSPQWLVLLPLLFVPVVAAKLSVHYIAYASYPSPVKMPIIIANYHINKKEQPPRILAPEIVAGPNQQRNIVLIIDESISGDYLSINGYNQATTPDLETLVAQGVITNFGVVNAVANCSAFSQLGLRIGLSPKTAGADVDYIATRKSLPTIYQYAKRAGYKTWLIDAQVKEGALTNYLTYDDLKSVDEYFTNSSRIEDYKRDLIALEKVKNIMAMDIEQKKFIVFVKDGAHWPYLWRVPKNSTFFKPGQTSEYEPMIKENREKVINTYMNLVRYAANDFLRAYVADINSTNTITFYTSDHGQTFMEDGSKDNLTHCSSYYDPPSSQAAVPLLVIEPPINRRYVPDARKIYSQHQIFPSMLLEMGYSDDLASRYGYSLLSGYPAETERSFYWSLEGNSSLYKAKASN
jgi:glucan phosphoethanolaminetransferase (alkaline phosphatase superfamily)